MNTFQQVSADVAHDLEARLSSLNERAADLEAELEAANTLTEMLEKAKDLYHARRIISDRRRELGSGMVVGTVPAQVKACTAILSEFDARFGP